MADPARPPVAGIERGTPDFRRVSLALFASGFATFALLYCVQPLLPLFSQAFGVSPAGASLSLSLTTAALAFAMPVAGFASDARGRKPIMVAALLVSAVLTVICAFVPDWTAILVLRALTGIALAGLPAVAMAYVGEEMTPRALGLAMGLYVSGTALGGMSGRLISAAVTDVWGWRTAVGAIGCLAVVCGLMLWRWLPASRGFVPRPARASAVLTAAADHLRDPVLRLLFVSSTVAGSLAARLGRSAILPMMIVLMLAGLALTAVETVWTVVAGLAVLTFGFFASHSTASAWVGARATRNRALASSLYLVAYYLGSSIAGTAGGIFWATGNWPGVIAITGCLIAAALSGAILLRRARA